MILNALGWFIIFSYFAFNFDDGAATCLANDSEGEKGSGHYVPLDKEPIHGKYAEVSETMRTGFMRFSVLALIMLGVNSSFSLFDMERKDFASLQRMAGIPVSICWLILWISMFITRYSTAGEICSGMYIESADYEKDPNVEAKYVIEMGLFIKFIWWLFFIFFLFVVMGVTILCCLMMKNTQHRQGR